MKSYRKELWFNTEKRYQLVHITPLVEEALRESGIKEGFCLVNAMHITSSVFINDNEPGLHKDYLEWLEKLAPYSRTGYHHNVGEDNGDAHLKRQVMGREVVVLSLMASSTWTMGRIFTENSMAREGKERLSR